MGGNLTFVLLHSGKKRLFPRFHFTSEADLLDILSNGNQPSKIMRHIDKLMLSTSTLVLESVPGNVSDRPRAVRFEAGVGDEIVEFEPAVFLEGKVNELANGGRVDFSSYRGVGQSPDTKRKSPYCHQDHCGQKPNMFKVLPSRYLPGILK